MTEKRAKQVARALERNTANTVRLEVRPREPGSRNYMVVLVPPPISEIIVGLTPDSEDLEGRKKALHEAMKRLAKSLRGRANVVEEGMNNLVAAQDTPG